MSNKNKEISNKIIYCVKSNNKMSDKTLNTLALSRIKHAGNIKCACAMVQQNTKGYKPPGITRMSGYYRVGWDGLDKLLIGC